MQLGLKKQRDQERQQDCRVT